MSTAQFVGVEILLLWIVWRLGRVIAHLDAFNQNSAVQVKLGQAALDKMDRISQLVYETTPDAIERRRMS